VHTVLHARVGGVPGALGYRLDRLGTRSAGEDPVLGVAQPGVGTAVGEGVPRGAFGAAQVGDGRLGQGAAQFDGAGEQPEPLPGQRPGQAGTGQKRVLPGQRLAGPGEFEQHARVGAEVGVLNAGEGTADAESLGDGPGVAVVRLGPAGAPVAHLGPQRTQLLGTGDERLQPAGDSGGQFLAVGDGAVLAEPQFRDGPVGAPGEFVQFVGPCGGGVGGAAYRGGAFGLEGGDRGGDGGADHGVHALNLP
jgi:hypothetical protein